ncbi:hypothetical protein C5167_003963 [Papaver somniferum]|uniref:protein ENHANCED PSEUDOMONAS SUSCEPTIBILTY 1-like n=1 Tax=Papaver somniferum TaxID=3469 RepID=UPI000E7049E9|nr:protein ENHANCED PSEUDOMONAS SUSCEPTIBILTY 1-like [Papaver somniferum]RZC92357.1 hypothetical protein C5167_003963 [Papaver somniferum]
MTTSETTSVVQCLSRCTIKPYYLHISEQIQQKQQQRTCNLTPWDLSFLSAHYMHFGLLFSKTLPSSSGDRNLLSMTAVIDQLKHSLSKTLAHFYPLSGRLITNKQDDPPSYSVSLDCQSDQGVEFIHATTALLTLDDILSPIYVPPFIKSFFAAYDNGDKTTINHDGHTVPLIGIQVTELVDGFFVAASFNHVVGDGNSFWHFFNSWAEISRTATVINDVNCISRPPIIDRWFMNKIQEDQVGDDDDDDNIINLPFSHHDEFIGRYPPLPHLVERIFHFSAESLSRLKTQANSENRWPNEVSSFQALVALVWRSITRARCLHPEQETTCELAIDDRWRLNPPLSKEYFGCYIDILTTATTKRELLNHDLGWAGWTLHKAVVGRTDQNVRKWLSDWIEEPKIFQTRPNNDQACILVGGSPRFDTYGCDFGWGKPLTVRSGWPFKFNGNVLTYPGRAGGGSIDVEICLSTTDMSALECDGEFMSAVQTYPG